ncbi:hypothetical protein Syun_029850 [Stephania yunnanensis]|uniref:Uncharacterized protein n=1 Tax=Stephania yunnanensis TaxID=152371 RepID=A0AAP0E6D4_9MAGN
MMPRSRRTRIGRSEGDGDGKQFGAQSGGDNLIYGQERFLGLGVSFCRGADCCVLVYDVNLGKSFESLNNKHEDFLKQANPIDPNTSPFVLLGKRWTSMAQKMPGGLGKEGEGLVCIYTLRPRRRGL